mgnify:CR=1 FL=1
MTSVENREHLYTQKLYPTVNNDDLLEFRIPPNPKGQLDLANAKLHFVATIATPATGGVDISPQNFFGPKQFSSLEIRVNGEAVSRRSCANEYFLASYFQTFLNYSLDYQTTALRPMGIYDYTQSTTAQIKTFPEDLKVGFKASRSNVITSKEYEILMPIDSTIFYANELLPSNTPLDLSFERLGGASSAILHADSNVDGSTLALEDCYLLLPFKKDDAMFQLERNAIQRPLKLRYDEYVIKRFNVPKGTSNVMMSDVIAGNLPNKLLWGLLSMDSYTGSFKLSSTRFNRNGMVKANMYINGKEAVGYPVSMSGAHVTLPFTKFLENSNQYQNGYLSRTISLLEFEQGNFILSQTIEPDTSGSVSFEFGFDSVLSKDLVLITCCIHDKLMRIDHQRNFQIT